MNALEAIVLGIVQGLTEFLPISSTGHLRIVPAFLGWDDPGAAFTAVTQLGTLAAVLLFFREDLWRIAKAWVRGLRDAEIRRTADARLGSFILVGTLPIGFFGWRFSDQIEDEARNLQLIASMLILLGLILLLAEVRGKRERDLDELTWKDGIVIGFAQALALVPGVSRSGATLTAGLFLNLERAAAARYSFLLSVPAVVASGVYEIPKIGSEGTVGVEPTVIATVFAFASGYVAIWFLLRLLQTHSTIGFVVYRVVLGILVLSLVWAGAID